MADSTTFKEKQYAFAAHIRDPANVAPPEGIDARRMAIYRKLFFNNLFNLLGTFFPVLRKIHTDDQWRRFIRGFMQHHQAKTPYFLQLPEEFLAYLQNEFEPSDEDYPFLLELAHYEYAELALAVSEDEVDLTGVDPDGDLLANVPVKSPLSWTYGYQYAVHRMIIRMSRRSTSPFIGVTMATWASWNSMPLRPHYSMTSRITNGTCRASSSCARLRRRSITPTPTRSLRMVQMYCRKCGSWRFCPARVFPPEGDMHEHT
jgi:hypothetical protein